MRHSNDVQAVPEPYGYCHKIFMFFSLRYEHLKHVSWSHDTNFLTSNKDAPVGATRKGFFYSADPFLGTNDFHSMFDFSDTQYVTSRRDRWHLSREQKRTDYPHWYCILIFLFVLQPDDTLRPWLWLIFSVPVTTGLKAIGRTYFYFEHVHMMGIDTFMAAVLTGLGG